MAGSELIDRIAAFLREQPQGVDATTIARDFLRLTGSSRTAPALVRAMLGRDARFVENPHGVWGIARAPASSLDPPALLAGVEIPAGASREPWLWRVFAAPWGAEERAIQHRGAAHGAELAAMLRAMAEQPVASDRSGALARWIGAQERLHAFPETEPVLIDLRAWDALLPEANAEDAGPGPGGGPENDRAHLDGLARRLERILEAARRRGLTSWGAVAAAPLEARESARAEVWDAPRAFTPAMLEALPEEPGVYRFLTQDRTVLYVGKTKNLRRRVASYFRPPGARGTRRDALLREIHRVEITPTGSELEALIRESQEIARRRPPWNVQVQLDPEPPEYALGEQELLLRVGGVSGAATLFLISGPRVGIVRLPAAPDATELADVLRGFYGDGPRPDAVEEIPAPERVLVRRWIHWEPGGIALLRLVDFGTFQDLAAAAVRASAPPTSDPPLRVRA
jgi:predicted GIY-YIG superfamily endonuclease